MYKTYFIILPKSIIMIIDIHRSGGGIKPALQIMNMDGQMDKLMDISLQDKIRFMAVTSKYVTTIT